MTNKPCQHLFNAHRQCQWCHRMQKDIDYEDGMRDLHDLLVLVAPQIEPMDSLSGMVSQINNFIAGNLYPKAEELLRLRNVVGQLKSLGEQYHANYRSDVFAHETLRLLEEAGVSEVPYLPVYYNGKSAKEWYHEYCQAALKQDKQ